MRYVFQRLMRFVIVFVIVTFLVLVITRIGVKDPARAMLGGVASEDQIGKIRTKYHLGSNYFVQYGYWLKNLITLDLGRSEIFSTPVTTLVRQKILVTTLLATYAIIGALVISVPLAVYSAYRRDGAFDKVASFLTFCLISVPGLVLGVLLSLLFVSRLGWFPRVSNKVYPWDSFSGNFKNFFLPTLSLMLPMAAVFTRLLRGDMCLTLQSDFILLARAKGVSPQRILWHHALRSSLFSVMTAVGLQLGALFGGAVVIESMFAMSGLGQLLAEAILRADLLVIQTGAALLVVAVVIANFLVDLLYAVVDPRIRHLRAMG